MGYVTSITVRVDASRGFDGTALAGTGLTPAQLNSQKDRIQMLQDVAQSMLNAVGRARAAGLDGFEPGRTDLLQMPAALTPADRDQIFTESVGRAWSGSALTLAQWTQAAGRLQTEAARLRSALPSGSGGAIQHVQGQWYVNGQVYSLSQLFTANRVNALFAMDAALQSSLNTIAANNRLVHRLSEMLSSVTGRTEGNPFWLILYEGYYKEESWGNLPTLSGGAIYAIDPPDDRVRADAVLPDTVLALALSIIGPDSVLAQGIRNGSTYPVNKILSGDQWKTAMHELSTIIDSKTGDNQIAQQRTETIITQRANLIDGLSNMLKGQQSLNSIVAHNY